MWGRMRQVDKKGNDIGEFKKYAHNAANLALPATYWEIAYVPRVSRMINWGTDSFETKSLSGQVGERPSRHRTQGTLRITP